jgi:hypothetical protein
MGAYDGALVLLLRYDRFSIMRTTEETRLKLSHLWWGATFTLNSSEDSIAS